MDLQKIGVCLKELRKEKDLTQADLADRFNVSVKTVSRWENGVHMPDLDILLELTDFYEVDLTTLLRGEIVKEKTQSETKATVQEVIQYSKYKKIKREIKKRRRVILLSVVLIAIAAFFLQHGCACSEVKYDSVAKAYLYDGHLYGPVQRYEPVRISLFPVARLNGNHYTLYPLANDPDHLFLYPRANLTSNMYMLGRIDAHLPDPSTDTISRIENGRKNGSVDQGVQDLLTGLLQGKYGEVDNGEPDRYGVLLKSYRFLVFFTDYPQVDYVIYISKYENVYILDIDGQRRIVFDSELGKAIEHN